MDSIKLIGCIGLLFAGLCGKAADNKEGIDFSDVAVIKDTAPAD